MKKLTSEKLLMIALIVVVITALFANRGFRNLIGHYKEIGQLKNERAQLAARNAKLKREIYLLEHDQSYVENIARKELGVVSKDEYEYRFKK